MLDLSRTREKMISPCSMGANSLTPNTITRVEVVSVEATEAAPTMGAIKQMLEKRLEIAREGISEAQEQLRLGNEEDAQILLEKVDEDLHLLRRRVRREFERAEMLSCQA